MVWLRPIEGAASASAPPLDDAAASQDAAAQQQQLEAALAERQAIRQKDFAGLLDTASLTYLSVAPGPTKKQLEALRAPPSAHTGGVVAAASVPRGAKKSARITVDPLESERVRRGAQPAASEAPAKIKPTLPKSMRTPSGAASTLAASSS